MKKKGTPVPFSFGPPLSYVRGKRSINDGVRDVLGYFYKHLGFDDLISGTKKNKQWNEMLKNLVLIRFLEPASKLRSIRLIQDRFQKVFSHNQILRMMDHLSKNEVQIKTKLCKAVRKKSQSLGLVLFDVTTLHFENVTETDLKRFWLQQRSEVQ